MPKGTIIFLNGTSSAGKTTLAYTLQERLPDPYQHMALDQFRDGLPAKYRGLNAPENTTGDSGLNVVPVTTGSKPYTAIKFGSSGQQMLKGMRRGIAEMAKTGNNVIIDDIILEEAFLVDYLEVMDGFDLYFVGVKCPLAVINEREKLRPGRFPGTAHGHFDICHAHGNYDVEVDTSRQNPQACAVSVIERLKQGPPTAFNELRATQSIR